MQGEDDDNGSVNPMGNVGRFTAGAESATGGTGGAPGGPITNGYYDIFISGGSSEMANSYAGTYTVPDATTGRFTASITSTGSSHPGSYAVYIIDANRMFMIETDPVSTSGTMQSGDIRLQQQSANTVAALLDGASVLYGQGYEYTSGSVSGYDSNLSQVSGTGNGTLTVNASYSDSNGSYQPGQRNGQTVSVTFPATPSAPGRATFSPGSDTVYFYFFGAGSAFYLDFNGAEGYVETGWLEQQTQTTFTNATLAGSYMTGKIPALKANSNDNIGEAIAASDGTVTGSQTTAREGDFEWDAPIAGTGYAWLSPTYGAFSLTQEGTPISSCIVITSTKDVCLDNTSGGASVSILQQ